MALNTEKKGEPGSEKGSWLADLKDFVKVFVVSAAVILVFVNFFAHPVTVEGLSMYPNLKDKEYGFTSLISARLGHYDRGDVVVLTMPDDENGQTHWVKRIIALPGETIEGRDGKIYVDGKVLDESAYIDPEYVAQWQQENPDYYFSRDFGPVTLADDEYFFMGDNRGVSKDARSVGPVKADQIYGRGVLVLYPFNEMGLHA